MLHDVVQVIPFEDYTVDVYFDDGKIVCYDVKPMLDKKAFERLKDLSFFMKSCTVLNGTLAWDVSGKMDPCSCIDIDPEMLHSLNEAQERIVRCLM